MKKPITPNSQIRVALRRLFLRSRERAEVLKQAKYTCSCGAKQSKAKGKEVSVECHHVDAIDWNGVVELIRERLLAGKMVCLCKKCHRELHKMEKENG